MKRITTLLLALPLLASAVRAGEPAERDRKAILAMAGEFAVNFRFEETLSLQAGYEAKKGVYDEAAHELVVVTEDSPRRISLQHLLVAGPMVIKHWAQIWTFEDTRIVDFQGNNAWKVRDISPEQAAGTWSQLVTQVDDSPRYESFGRWVHRGEISEWTSQETPRPLPRREHTKRKDYQLIGGTNRHTIAPWGWAHEQDNTKLQLKDGQQVPLAREFGLNTYTRVTDFNFQAARDFWNKESAFWGTVAGAWEEVQATRSEFAIADKFDVPALRKAVTAIQEQQRQELKGKVSGVIQEFLNKKEQAAAEAPAPAPEAPAAVAAPVAEPVPTAAPAPAPETAAAK